MNCSMWLRKLIEVWSNWVSTMTLNGRKRFLKSSQILLQMTSKRTKPNWIKWSRQLKVLMLICEGLLLSWLIFKISTNQSKKTCFSVSIWPKVTMDSALLKAVFCLSGRLDWQFQERPPSIFTCVQLVIFTWSNRSTNTFCQSMKSIFSWWKKGLMTLINQSQTWITHQSLALKVWFLNTATWRTSCRHSLKAQWPKSLHTQKVAPE